MFNPTSVKRLLLVEIWVHVRKWTFYKMEEKEKEIERFKDDIKFSVYFVIKGLLRESLGDYVYKEKTRG